MRGGGGEGVFKKYAGGGLLKKICRGGPQEKYAGGVIKKNMWGVVVKKIKYVRGARRINKKYVGVVGNFFHSAPPQDLKWNSPYIRPGSGTPGWHYIRPVSWGIRVSLE